jgi:hypothetical protein
VSRLRPQVRPQLREHLVRRAFLHGVSARHILAGDVLPRQPIRQWVLSLPFALRYLLATRPEVVTQVLGIVYRARYVSRPLVATERLSLTEGGYVRYA